MKAAPGRMRAKASAPRKPRLSLVTAATTKTVSLVASTVSRSAGSTTGLAQHRRRQPGVVGAQPGAEAGEEPGEGVAEVAEADEADLRAREQPGGGVAGAAPELAALAEGEVGVGDAAGEVEREAEAELGHRLGEDRAGRHRVDAAREEEVVGHVVEKVALDVEDAAELRHRLDGGAGERRLADEVARSRQHGRVEPADRGGLGLDERVACFEPRPRLGREDQLERARLRRADDERLVSDHSPPPRLRIRPLSRPSGRAPAPSRRPGARPRAPTRQSSRAVASGALVAAVEDQAGALEARHLGGGGAGAVDEHQHGGAVRVLLAERQVDRLPRGAAGGGGAVRQEGVVAPGPERGVEHRHAGLRAAAHDDAPAARRATISSSRRQVRLQRRGAQVVEADLGHALTPRSDRAPAGRARAPPSRSRPSARARRPWRRRRRRRCRGASRACPP